MATGGTSILIQIGEQRWYSSFQATNYQGSSSSVIKPTTLTTCIVPPSQWLYTHALASPTSCPSLRPAVALSSPFCSSICSEWLLMSHIYPFLYLVNQGYNRRRSLPRIRSLESSPLKNFEGSPIPIWVFAPLQSSLRQSSKVPLCGTARGAHLQWLWRSLRVKRKC